MSNYVLIINGLEVDLPSDFQTEFTRQGLKVGELRNVNSDFTSTISLPITARNTAIFKSANVIGNANRFAYNTFKCQLRYGSIPLLEQGVGFIDDITTTINISIRSSVADPFIPLDRPLSDLNLDSLDHIYDCATIAANMANSWQSGFSYPVIDYGTGAALNPSIPATDLFPAMFYHYLMVEVFSQFSGYTIKGQFFETDNFYLSCILPFVNEEFLKVSGVNLTFTGANSAGSFTFNGDSTYDIDGQQVVILAGSGYTILPADAGLINYTTSGTVELTVINTVGSGNAAAFLGIFINGVLANTTATGSINVIAGDLVELGVVIDWNILASTPAGQLDVSYTATDCEYTLSETITPILYGDTVTMSINLPDMTALEFVKGVMHQFGLMIGSVNNLSKEIEFISINELTNKAYGVQDFTQKLSGNYTRLQTRFEDYGQSNWFKYLPDDTVPDGLGDYFESISDTTLQASADIIELPFAASEMVTGSYFVPLLEQIAFIPHFIAASGGGWDVQEVQPRSLYVTRGLGVLLIFEGLTVVPTTAYSFAKFNDPTRIQNLNFGSLLQFYYNGLFDKILNDCVRIEAMFNLKATDVKNVDFKQPVYLDQFGAYFMMEQVQAFVGDRSLTKCFLARIK